MTKEHIIKLRTLLEGFPILVTSDNQRLYYDGAIEGNVLIWDDDEEIMQVIRPCIDQQAQNLYPVEVVFIEYDTIQEITLYPDRKRFMEYLEGIKGKLDENKYKKILDMSAKAYHNKFSYKSPLPKPKQV